MNLASVPLHGERLRKERFGHPVDAVCIGFLCWVFQERLSDVIWTTVVDRMDAVPNTWEQEEVWLPGGALQLAPVLRRHQEATSDILPLDETQAERERKRVCWKAEVV
jgi:hypothetical protein